jgi:hypothetical protein
MSFRGPRLGNHDGYISWQRKEKGLKRLGENCHFQWLSFVIPSEAEGSAVLFPSLGG